MELLISPCKQLLTLAGPPGPRRSQDQSTLGIIEDGALWISGTLIKRSGPRKEVERDLNTRKLRRISAEDCIVMPGFVDSHSHPVFLSAREDEYELRILGKTCREIAEAGGGILASVRGVRKASLEQLLAVSLPRLALFLRHGTTTLEAKSGYGLDLENEIKLLEVIRQLQLCSPLELVPTFLGAHEIPPEHREQPSRYIELLVEKMIPEIARQKLAEYCDCFAEPHLFPLPEMEKIMKAARAHGLKIRLHADQWVRSGAAQAGARLGAISVDHLEQITGEDVEVLSKTGTIATLLPGSVFHLGLSCYPPARKLIEAGVPVALATDFNPGSSPTCNMQMILSLACAQMRMSPAEAIVAATLNGAWALERADRLGTLEPGKQADLAIMNVEDYRQIPYYFGVNHCRMTIKAGKIIPASEESFS
jgi:imidazolonepropionase